MRRRYRTSDAAATGILHDWSRHGVVLVAGRGELNRPGVVAGLSPREGGSVPAPRKYPDELRERALRLVQETANEDPSLSLNAAARRTAGWSGSCRTCCGHPGTQRRIDTVQQPGTTSDDAARIKEMERESRELKRASEVLSVARSFFAWELDPQLPW
jgi:transposase